MKKGDVIRIEYIGRLESGEIFDLTYEEIAKKENIFSPKAKYGAVPVVVGAGFMLPGLDRELEKMSPGEEKEIIVEPRDAFGERKDGMVNILSLKAFKEEPKPGSVVNFGNAIGRIQSVSGGRVRVDFNHPLAGKRLKYKVKIGKKIEGEKEKITAAMEFFGINADRIEISEASGKSARIFSLGPKDIEEKIASVITRWFGFDSVEFIQRFEKKPGKEKSKGN